MIDALLRHKLSTEQENMEDILTSTVFGIFRYMSPQEGILPFLARARTVCADHVEFGDGDRPFASLEKCNDAVSVDYDFWPRWSHCEPDVLVRVRFNERDRWLIAVEAKYRSGKSSEADDSVEDPTDQLAREWCDAVGEAEKVNAQPLLIYLTADVACPRHEIQAALAELRQKRPHEQPCIAWLSWRELSESVFAKSRLDRLAVELGFLHFRGFAPLNSAALTWRFGNTMRLWNWNLPAYKNKWEFRNG